MNTQKDQQTAMAREGWPAGNAAQMKAGVGSGQVGSLVCGNVVLKKLKSGWLDLHWWCTTAQLSGEFGPIFSQHLTMTPEGEESCLIKNWKREGWDARMKYCSARLWSNICHVQAGQAEETAADISFYIVTVQGFFSPSVSPVSSFLLPQVETGLALPWALHAAYVFPRCPADTLVCHLLIISVYIQ